MLYKIWKLCNKRKWFRLANALAYYNASGVRWKMLPPMIPPGLTSNRFQSLVNGWYDGSCLLGWIKEIENPYLDSDPGLENWDMKFDLLPETKITVRPRW